MYAHAGIPCTTFSTMLALQRRVLRLRGKPEGRGGLKGRDKTDVAEANQLVRISCATLRAVFDTGGEFTFESVADVGDPSLPCYWPERASMCPLSRMRDIKALCLYAGVEQFHVPLSSFHDGVGEIPPTKWVTIYASRGVAIGWAGSTST